jgi:thiamine biosynthesis protein ThiI
MNPPGADTILVRFSGEVGVKSPSVQQQMEERVRENLKSMLSEEGHPVSTEYAHNRLYVHTDPPDVGPVGDVVANTFGITSLSPVVEVEPTIDAICEALHESAREHYDGGSFAVRARRAGQESAHPFSSIDIERQGGAAVSETAREQGNEPEVDLDSPDMTFGVECRPERAFVYLQTLSGPGGLPLGTQAPVVALVSGGIDSPVAAWELMKRGCPIAPVYVDLGKFGGVDHQARAEQTVRELVRYTPDGLPLWVVPGGEGLATVVESTVQYPMVLARRFMLQIAAEIAERTDAVGIVTGESIGQKSSQTSASLRVTGAVTDLPVHRPLLNRDKNEISDRARAIGTYSKATIDAGCNRLAPDNPSTNPPLERVREAEPATMPELAIQAVERADVITFRGPE